jgi:WD40 repeat protein
MSGLDFALRKTLSATDILKLKTPPDFGSALNEFVGYCEDQLPSILEIDFIPLAFDITKDESSIVLGSKQGNIAIFSVEENKQLKDEEKSKGSIKSLVLIGDDTQLAVVTSMFEILVLDFPSLEKAHKIELKPFNISLKSRPGKDLFYYSNCANEIYVVTVDRRDDIQLDERKYIQRPIKIHGSVVCIDISDDGSLIAAGLSTGEIQLLYADTESELQCTEAYNFPPNMICFSEHRRLLAASFTDNVLKVWNINSTLSLKNVFNHHTNEITGIGFVKDNRYMISSSKDKNIIMWDMKVDRYPYFMKLIDEEVLWLKSSLNHKKVFFSQNQTNFLMWNVPYLNKNVKYSKHTQTINKIEFIPGNYEVISVGSDGLVVIWDYRNDLIQKTIQLEGELLNVVASKSGQYCFIVSSKPCLYKLGLSDYEYESVEIGCDVMSIKLSDNEITVALGDTLGRILVYESEIMERKLIIKGHTRPISGLHFIKDDNIIISSSFDTTLAKSEVSNGNRISTFYGHKSPITTLLYNKADWIISASEDLQIIIWNVEGIILYTFSANKSGKVNGLYSTVDNLNLIILQEFSISYWQIYNLSIISQEDFMGRSASLSVTIDEKILSVSIGNDVFVQENPIRSQHPRVIGKSQGSPHMFMKYIVDTIKNKIKVKYNPMFNGWVYTPYLIGVSHILSYKNLNEELNASLFSQKNPASFFCTLRDENPLSISADLAYKNCIDICLKFLRSNARNNPRAYVPIESCLTKLNTLDLPGIVKLYDILYQKSNAAHLPTFCLLETELPSLYHSDEFIIIPEKIVPSSFHSVNGRSVAFYQSMCPLDLDTGTNGSIEFLESLLDSPEQIFRSRLLQVILNNKWDRIKWAVYGQGLLYILYMIMLSFFCVSFNQSKVFLMALFVVHVLLFLYEVTQIATGFFGYWLDLWNILDQLRGFSFTIYAITIWRGEDNMTLLLAVMIFSWTRGISYFRMFNGTRYMVRLLSEVIKDMREFFVVLFYSTLAFTFVLLLRKPDHTFSEYLGISYRLDLGDFDADYATLFDWVIFFLATMINPLIMLNLLISIMGDTYAKVQESNDIANYQELTEMIIEIEKLMFWKKQLTHKHYLQQCDFSTNEESSADRLVEKFRVLKSQVTNIESSLNSIKKILKDNNTLEVEGYIQELKKDQDTMKTEIQSKLEKNSELIYELSKRINKSS